MGMSQASAAVAAEGRQRPALFWLATPEGDAARLTKKQELEAYIESLPEEDFVELPEEKDEQ